MMQIRQNGFVQTPALACDFCNEQVEFRIYDYQHRWKCVTATKYSHRLVTTDGSNYEVCCEALRFQDGNLATHYQRHFKDKSWRKSNGDKIHRGI